MTFAERRFDDRPVSEYPKPPCGPHIKAGVLIRALWQRWLLTADRIASTKGLLIGAGFALEILAMATFPDPRLGQSFIRYPIALVCGLGGGIGLSALFLQPTRFLRKWCGICLIVAAILRAGAFAWITARGSGLANVLVIAPIATMMFPFLLGVGLWRRASSARWITPTGRADE